MRRLDKVFSTSQVPRSNRSPQLGSYICLPAPTQDLEGEKGVVLKDEIKDQEIPSPVGETRPY